MNLIDKLVLPKNFHSRNSVQPVLVDWLTVHLLEILYTSGLNTKASLNSSSLATETRSSTKPHPSSGRYSSNM